MSSAWIAVLVGVATWYGPGFEGEIMACDTWDQDLVFSREIGPFVAVDPVMIRDHGWACGDRVKISFEERGIDVWARVLDTGPLNQYWIADYGPGVPIVVDVAAHAWPLDPAIMSGLVRVENVDLEERAGWSGGPTLSE